MLKQHVAEFFAPVGGGLKEPGWLTTQLSTSRIALVPGDSHGTLLASPDPLSNPLTDAAAAWQVAP